jgi:hypothetical protein
MSEDNDSRSDYTRSAQQDQNSDSGEPQTGSSGDELEFVFLCKIDNARIVSNILSALQFKKDNQVLYLISVLMVEVSAHLHAARYSDHHSKWHQIHGRRSEELSRQCLPAGHTVSRVQIHGRDGAVSHQLQHPYGYGSSLILM